MAGLHPELWPPLPGAQSTSLSALSSILLPTPFCQKLYNPFSSLFFFFFCFKKKKFCGQKKVDVQAGEAEKVLRTRKRTTVCLKVLKLLSCPRGSQRSPQGGAAGPPRRRDRGTPAGCGCNAAWACGAPHAALAPRPLPAGPRGQTQTGARVPAPGNSEKSTENAAPASAAPRAPPHGVPDPQVQGPLSPPPPRRQCGPSSWGPGESLPGRVALTEQQGMKARAGLPPAGGSSRNLRARSAPPPGWAVSGVPLSQCWTNRWPQHRLFLGDPALLRWLRGAGRV